MNPVTPPLLVDSITEAIGTGTGRVVVSGSHGGISAGRFALQAGVRLAVFNDAGVGRDRAGVAGLDLLQAQGIAACTVSHDSARIGESASTFECGVISHANAAAAAMGAAAGLRLRDWLATLPG
ncbi:MAG TPA: hypothetical protein PLG32_11250 [Piscinibacter sp.]|nr:hypothetical protein [Piscinibacter sp.]